MLFFINNFVMKIKLIIALSFLLSIGCSKNREVKTSQQLETKRELHVSLYPYIPNAESFYSKVEKLYESEYPEIDLILELNSWYYYDHEGKGIIESDADVFEIDAILLQDFIDRGKIQRLPDDVIPIEQNYLPASKVAKIKDVWFGHPHWACGNFLYIKNNDKEALITSNLTEIEGILSKFDDINNNIIIDLKGKSTIGEQYFDALIDEFGDYNLIKQYISTDNINQTVLNNMNRVIDLSYKDFGRNDDYHDNTGFYARQFARNKGSFWLGILSFCIT